KRHGAARPLRPASATRWWGRPRTPAPWHGYPSLQPDRPGRARSARLPPACHEKWCHDAPENNPRTRCTGIAAKGRHWDARWRAGCSSPASRDSHSPDEDKSAWTCRPHGGVGSWTAEGPVAPVAGLGDAQSLAHTGHNAACASSPRTLWARWTACAWAGPAQVGRSDLVWTP